MQTLIFYCMKIILDSINLECKDNKLADKSQNGGQKPLRVFYAGFASPSNKLEPQGALIAHLSTMSTSVIS